jgi:hypothetical protein
MPDRKRLNATQSHVAAALGPIDGARVPGGCDSCDAYQSAEPIEAGVWIIAVYHDDWCPIYRRATGQP